MNSVQDERFNPDIDKRTGYHTKAILCQPIIDVNGNVIAVVEAINKPFGFSQIDICLMDCIAKFSGYILRNIQMYDAEIRQKNQNKALLNVSCFILIY